ncbi:MAG: hypothetical protein JST53_01060 [Actinobacteria bacterium]|nr:hypothetical protein [Actinomycetota bacterium]
MVDLVSPDPIASSLTLPLVVRMAGEIAAALLNGYAGKDRALLDEFLRAERGGSRRPVFAINERLVIANPFAADLLPDGGHLLLWEQVQRALRSQRSDLLLSGRIGGTQLRARVLRVQEEGNGAILRVFEPEEEPGGRANRGDPTKSAKADLAARLPGRSTAWVRVRDHAHDLVSRGEWMLLKGPPGIGKSALARAATQGIDPMQPLPRHEVPVARQLDTERWLVELAAAADVAPRLFVAHLERLDDIGLERFCGWLEQVGEGGLQVIAGYTSQESLSTVPPVLLGQFPNVLDIPPLEDRPEDVLEIAAAIAAVGSEGTRIEPKAAGVLTQYHWPGNVRQLRRVVLSAQAACPGSVIRAADVPDLIETRSAARPLSSLERVERRAILDALRTSGQNKQAAAAELGISRATLYRKLSVLGIKS